MISHAVSLYGRMSCPHCSKENGVLFRTDQRKKIWLTVQWMTALARDKQFSCMYCNKSYQLSPDYFRFLKVESVSFCEVFPIIKSECHGVPLNIASFSRGPTGVVVAYCHCQFCSKQEIIELCRVQLPGKKPDNE